MNYGEEDLCILPVVDVGCDIPPSTQVFIYCHWQVLLHMKPEEDGFEATGILKTDKSVTLTHNIQLTQLTHHVDYNQQTLEEMCL